MKKQKEKTTISGQISSVKFRNSEGWSVFSVRDSSSSSSSSSLEDALNSSLPIIYNCTGTLAGMCEAGSEVTCTGTMELGPYGRQLKCETIVPAAPDVSTDAGVVKLLQRLPGIGPKKAMQAVQQYGHVEAWKLAGSDPEKIGVKPADAEEAKRITATLLESYNATVYLLGIGLTDHQAAVIYKMYGNDTIRVVSEDPYQMVEIDGFGFITIDKIALKAGVGVGNVSRINACILYVLDDSATNGGNIWHSGWSLVDIVLNTLTETAMKAEVSLVGAPDKETVRRQVHFMASEGKIVIQKGRVFSRNLLEAEQAIFDFISGGLQAANLPQPVMEGNA
jgi:exodeoxyribonuclease V alpha subunit